MSGTVVSERCLDLGFDRRVGRVQAADAVPLGRVRAKIGLRRGGARGPHFGQALAITHHHRIVGIELRCQRAGKFGLVAVIGQAKERPRPFAKPHHQPRFRQQPQMARYARLGLAQDFGELRDRHLGLGQEREQAQPRLLTGCLEHGGKFVESEAILSHAPHIKISLCRRKRVARV